MYMYFDFQVLPEPEPFVQNRAYQLDPTVQVIQDGPLIHPGAIGSKCRSADAELPTRLINAVTRILES